MTWKGELNKRGGGQEPDNDGGPVSVQGGELKTSDSPVVGEEVDKCEQLKLEMADWRRPTINRAQIRTNFPLTAGRRTRDSRRAMMLTSVSWLPSLAATSARLFRLACNSYLRGYPLPSNQNRRKKPT